MEYSEKDKAKGMWVKEKLFSMTAFHKVGTEGKDDSVIKNILWEKSDNELMWAIAYWSII